MVAEVNVFFERCNQVSQAGNDKMPLLPVGAIALELHLG
jgi:hypothetical protein